MLTQLTHLDENNNPRMVDVQQKEITRRYAHARGAIYLPPNVIEQIEDGDIKSKKGSVFQTAIVAGIMGAKKTGDLVPMCHPIGMDNCSIEININDQNEAIIDCYTKVTARTGIEMEALTGVSVAALTIYDMCKALSRELVIRKIYLVEKRGGKSDFNYQK